MDSTPHTPATHARTVSPITMLHWRRVRDHASGAAFRPGLGTVWYRLIISATVAMFMAIAHFVLLPFLSEREPTRTEAALESARSEVSQIAAGVLDDEALARIEARAETREAARSRTEQRDARIRQAVSIGYPILMGVPAMAALLPLVSLAWNRLHLTRDTGGNLVIAHRGLLPSRRPVPLAAVTGIRVVALQHTSLRLGGAWKYRSYLVAAGWRWRVALETAQPGAYTAEFVVQHTADKPVPGRPAPQTVRDLVQSLHRLTGLPVTGPVVVYDPRVRENDPGGFRSTKAIPLEGPDGRVRRYRAVEEMPPGVRARFEETYQRAADSGRKPWE